MLQLYVENQPLDLPLDVAIRLQLKNPMFNEIGSYSLPFKISGKSTRNDKILGFPNRVEKAELITKEKAFYLSFNSKKIFEGTIVISKGMEGEIDAYLKVGDGDFYSQIKKVNLDSIEYGDKQIATAPYYDVIPFYNSLIDKYYPETNFNVFPVYDEDFLKGTPYDVGGYGLPAYGGYFNHCSSIYQVFFPNAYFVTFPFLQYVIKRIAEFTSHNIERNIFASNPDLSKLVVFNNYFQAYTTYQAFADYDYIINQKNSVPSLPVSEFIRGLETLLNITFFPDNDNRTLQIISNNDIILNPYYLDLTKYALKGRDIEYENLDGFKLSSENDSNDGWISDHVIDIDFSLYNLKDAVYDVVNLPASGNDPNDLRLVRHSNKYYSWALDLYTFTFAWKYVTDNFLSYSEGNKQLLISSIVSAPMMSEELDANGYYWTVPKIKQRMNSNKLYDTDSKLLSLNNVDISPRLLFYRGLQPGGYDKYPLGTYDNYNHMGQKISGANLSLRFNGDYGLYKNMWKHYLYWYLNIRKKVIYNLYLNASQLSLLKFYNKVRIDRINYLIDNLDITIRNNSIDPTKATLFKV